jgi:hypothetical protein
MALFAAIIALLVAAAEYKLAAVIDVPSIVGVIAAVQVGLFTALLVLGGVPRTGGGLGH